MHILVLAVVNDDGPPSCQSSPYVHAFVLALQARGHVVSVVLPHVQRSWIGKAHFVNQMTKPTYFRPGSVHEDDGTTHDRPLTDADASDIEEWVLVDGTPATCTQLGLFHFYQDRGPVDVVVSGPNFGRNSTALFSLSSGTVGGAMEAALCGFKGIALSYAFSPEGRYLREPIEAACRLSAKLVDYLVTNWDDDVELYNVNVPLLRDVETRTIRWTDMLANKWISGSSFKEVSAEDEKEVSANENEAVLRREGEAEAGGHVAIISHDQDVAETTGARHARHVHRHFKWTPSFKDVHATVKASKEGNDGWAVHNDYISVTPMKANFLMAKKRSGELKLDEESSENTHSLSASGPANLTIYTKYEDSYVQPLIDASIKKIDAIIDTSTRPFADRGSPLPFLQISQYESIDHSLLFKTPGSFMANSYIIRKALIRKEYLASIVRHWAAKNPEGLLGRCVPESISLHLDYAEFLDDALMEGDGMVILPTLEMNEQIDAATRSWWIVKASMADRGQGIRLFSTYQELQAVFEDWEQPESENEEDNEADSEEKADEGKRHEPGGDGMTSNLRHFILQKYISPLLLPSKENRKFHVRCYVVAVGALKVYVYRNMLALFAVNQYEHPSQAAENLDLSTHLTNTCLQDGTREGSVENYWDLPEPAGLEGWKEKHFEAICEATGQLFQAARSSPTDFQPLPNAFELYGVDWLMGYNDDDTSSLQVWLLEVNAFPDMKQTGDKLQDLVGGLWDGIVEVAIAPFFRVGTKNKKSAQDLGMHLVFSEDMKR